MRHIERLPIANYSFWLKLLNVVGQWTAHMTISHIRLTSAMTLTETCYGNGSYNLVAAVSLIEMSYSLHMVIAKNGSILVCMQSIYLSSWTATSLEYSQYQIRAALPCLPACYLFTDVSVQ